MAAVVSCDVVGHSRALLDDQRLRVRGVNDVVQTTLFQAPAGSIVWASGGDGGHVVFLGGQWHQSAIDLIARLRQWAKGHDIPLRVTGHYGRLETIPGADDKMQPLGEAINTAGWMLERTSETGIIVSAAFRQQFENRDSMGLVFHAARTLAMRDDRSIKLFLMMLPDLAPPSVWAAPASSDRAMFADALRRRDGWDVIYYAKRLFQVDSNDEEVNEALAEVDSSYFRLSGQQPDNPIFESLRDWEELRRLVKLGQLVERGYNEYLCRSGDTGDTMFVVLQGQVGAVRSDGEEASFVFERGALTGELAFALGSKRTAHLITQSETALLSFDLPQVLEHGIHQGVWNFITGRVLEHVSGSVSYLFGNDLTARSQTVEAKDLDAAVTARGDTVKRLAKMLLPGTILISIGENESFTLERLCTLEPRCEEGGLYLLVAGIIGSESIAGKRRGSDSFPLIYADIPGTVVAPDHRYKVQSEFARILFISRSAIEGLRSRRRHVIEGLKQQISSLYHYDAVISYEPGDEWVAEIWTKAFSDEGLVTIADPPLPSHAASPKTAQPDEVILDALAMIPLITSNLLARPATHSRLQRSVDLRVAHFDNPCILPVAWHSEGPGVLSLNYASITTDRGEQAAIDAVIARVHQLRGGLDLAPFKEQRSKRPVSEANPRLLAHRPSSAASVAGDEARYNFTLDMRGSSLGQLSLGGTVTNLHTSIGALRSEGDPRIADALEAIGRSVASAPELTADQRAALTENVEDLAEQALASPDQRKRGRVKAALQAVKETTGVAASIADAVREWGDVLSQLL